MRRQGPPAPSGIAPFRRSQPARPPGLGVLLGVLFASLLGAGCEDFDGIPWRNLYGFLRLLEFDKAKQVLRVHTYPPYLNQYIAQDDAEDFVLPWP